MQSLQNNLKIPESEKNIKVILLMSVRYWRKAGLPWNKHSTLEVGLEVLFPILA